MESTKKVFHVMYDDDGTLMAAAQKLVAQGIRVKDVYSPFPVHGIDPVIGIKRTRLAIASFMYAMTGTSLALLGMWYFMIQDWPMNIGGKPALPFPSMVPITFELTVLFAAHGMVITFFIVGSYWPGKRAKLLDIRQTDDVFIIALDKDKLADEAAVKAVLEETGAYDIQETEYEK